MHWDRDRSTVPYKMKKSDRPRYACTQEGLAVLLKSGRIAVSHRDVTYGMPVYLPLRSAKAPCLAQSSARLPSAIVMGGVVLLQALWQQLQVAPVWG